MATMSGTVDVDAVATSGTVDVDAVVTSGTVEVDAEDASGAVGVDTIDTSGVVDVGTVDASGIVDVGTVDVGTVAVVDEETGVSLCAIIKDTGIEAVAKDGTPESGTSSPVTAAEPVDDTAAESYGIVCETAPIGGPVNVGDVARAICPKSKSRIVVVAARAPRGARSRVISIFLNKYGNMSEFKLMSFWFDLEGRQTFIGIPLLHSTAATDK